MHEFLCIKSNFDIFWLVFVIVLHIHLVLIKLSLKYYDYFVFNTKTVITERDNEQTNKDSFS